MFTIICYIVLGVVLSILGIASVIDSTDSDTKAIAACLIILGFISYTATGFHLFM